MTINYEGKEYDIIPRNATENFDLLDSIQSAEKLLIDMIQDVSYTVSSDFNKECKEKFESILTALFNLKYDIASNKIILYRPHYIKSTDED